MGKSRGPQPEITWAPPGNHVGWQAEENAQLKVNIVLSQIRPHFLFNSLAVIQEICRTDPALAETAIGQFARYLRHNMDALTTDKMILFTTELEHARCYAALQQLRFGDALQFEYDLPCTSFTLPTLTLQPLIENAVTHGVRGNSDGCGTVLIRTREYPDRFELSVEDDGPGFQPEVTPQDGRSHIGIQNVRSRLKWACGGTLRIESAPGRGTVATIVLPKEGEGLC